jgi:hypothetical protein
MSTLQFEGVTSVTSDIDDAEYARIMRRITIADGGTDTDVSAFNSSI